MGFPAIIYIGILIFSSVYDFKYYKVLDFVHIILFVLALFNKNKWSPEYFLDIVYSFLFFVFLLVIAACTDCMGGGDVKFIFSNMIFLGFLSGCRALFLSCVLIVLFHFRSKHIIKMKIAMIPYLSVGFAVVFLCNSFRVY